jgi:hypothetical protein
MRSRFLLDLALIVVVVGLTAANAQDSQTQQDDVLGDFIGTRGAGFGAPDTPKSAGPRNKGTTAGNTKSAAGKTGNRPKQQPGTKGSNKGAASQHSSAGHSAKADTTVKAGSASTGAAAIGLGYTLYIEDAQGDGVRVDPAREFNEGDSIRLGLEANTNGYIYVFHTEDGRSPQMLFPNAKVDAGSNRLSAHVLETVPSSAWFTFDANPAIERLYIVISREPLAGVPTGTKLVEVCSTVQGDCFWKPSAEVWQRISSSVDGARVVESKSEIAEVKAPAGTLKRGFTITKSEPAPSVVRMNASSMSDLLVTTIDLVHK